MTRGVRDKGSLGEFYRRLIANGKTPMVALVAVMRKIIVIINPKIKDLLAERVELNIA